MSNGDQPLGQTSWRVTELKAPQGPGPPRIPIRVTLRFRCFKYAVAADTENIFYQVH